MKHLMGKATGDEETIKKEKKNKTREAIKLFTLKVQCLMNL